MKKLLNILSAPWLMAFCLVVFAISMAIATFFENQYGTPMARQFFYNSIWFEAILVVGAINLISSIFVRKLYLFEKMSVFLFHIAFIIIILGAGATRYLGFEGVMQIREGESSNKITLANNTQKTLPFSLFLKDFIIDFYPGSMNPSGFESKVVLEDMDRNIREEKRIFMNNILVHRGYRFYQSSYSPDQKGTVLSVSKDGVGTTITYIGYMLLVFGILWSIFNKNTNFQNIISKKQTAFLLLLICTVGMGYSQANDTIPIIPANHAEKFGSILVRDFQGRTKPISTLTSDIFRKVGHANDYHGQNSMQIMLAMLVYPEKWQNVKFIYAGSQAAVVLQLKNDRVSLLECYRSQGQFTSSQIAYEASQKSPASRTKTDNAVIRFDERLNIIFHWFMGNMLTIFPNPSDNSGQWYNPINIKGNLQTADSVFVDNIITYYLEEVRNSVKTGDWTNPDKIVDAIKKYQQKYGTNLPDNRSIRLEQWYNKSNLFKYTSYLYFLFGLFLLTLQLIVIFSENRKFPSVNVILSGAIAGVFLLHSIGLAIRWYISGHAPWSNAYESMIFIAWSAALAGIILARKNKVATAIAAILASIFLLVAQMAWMDPQITNLVPVLKSKWLVIHVAVITSSYGFLGIGALMAFINLFMISIQTKNNYNRTSIHTLNLTRIIEIAITIGLYLLTIGTFLGAIWANVSWGRYWGWDPKETWALITVIVYAFVLHMRIIPGVRSEVSFNILALVSYSSVLMTYFGVNYYLSGMHSYGKGDSAPIPIGTYIAIVVVVLVSVWAIYNNRRLTKIKRGTGIQQ